MTDAKYTPKLFTPNRIDLFSKKLETKCGYILWHFVRSKNFRDTYIFFL